MKLTDTGIARNRETIRQGFEREIAENRRRARELRDEAARRDAEADEFERQLALLSSEAA